MRYIIHIASFILSLCTFVPALLAADVFIVDKGDALRKKYKCAVLLKGRISPGDAGKLKRLLNNLYEEGVCFDSPGGDFREAVRILHALADTTHHYYTSSIIPPKAKCIEACAIAFLGGSKLLVEMLYQPDRTLYEGGVLAFSLPSLQPHGAPPVDANKVEAAYDDAVEAISGLLTLRLEYTLDRFIPYKLLGKVLTLADGEILNIQPEIQDINEMTLKYHKSNGKCILFSNNKSYKGCDDVKTY